MNSFCSFSSLPSSIAKFSYIVPAWEPSDSFAPLSVKRHGISLVRHDGKPLQPGPRFPQLYNSHFSSDWVDSVSRDDVSADVSMLPFPDPATFISNQLHCHLQEWKRMAASSCSYVSQDVLGWLANKVQVQLFFRHLREILRRNILTRPPHLSGSFTITGRVLPLPSLSLTRFCNASLPVLFRFGIRWARWILLTSSPSRLNPQNL